MLLETDINDEINESIKTKLTQKPKTLKISVNFKRQLLATKKTYAQNNFPVVSVDQNGG